MRRHKAFGDLSLLDAGNAVPNLANHRLDDYTRVLDAHVVPRLGNRRVRDLTPNVVRGCRAKLERSGVGRALATGRWSYLAATREPWRRHDWKNWRRRMWHRARQDGIEPLPPYDL